MANLNSNRVDAIIPNGDMGQISAAVNTITQLLPGAGQLTLTDAERASLRSMNVDNRQFAGGVADIMTRPDVQQILPQFMAPVKLQNDLALADQMELVAGILANAQQKVEDIRRIASNEAMATADTVYGILEVAARMGINGAQAAYDALKAHYAGQGGTGNPGNPTP